MSKLELTMLGEIKKYVAYYDLKEDILSIGNYAVGYRCDISTTALLSIGGPPTLGCWLKMAPKFK